MNRVLVYGMNSSDWGGIETYLMNMNRNFDRQKLCFDFILEGDSCTFEEEIKKQGGKIFYITPRKKNMISNILDMRKVLQQNKGTYQCLYMNLVLLHYIALFLIALSCHYKVIVHSHMARPDKINRLYFALHCINRSYVVKRSAQLFCCSTEAGDWLFGKKAMKSDKVVIVHNAILAQSYVYNSVVRTEVRKRMNLENKLVVGHVGRFVYQKNHAFLIDVFYEIHKKNPDSVLMLVGSGELEPQIRQKVADLNLSGSVRFMGVCTDVPQLLQAMDVFVFPSFYEGLAIAAIEAQAAGLPVVASQNISKDENITGLLSYCSLEQSPREWADLALTAAQGNERRNTYREVKNAGYDIVFEAKRLQDLFLAVGTGQSSAH